MLQLQFTALCDFTETTLEVQDVQLAAMQNGVAKKLTAKTAALTVSGGIQPGDADLNGSVDTDDLLLLRRALAGLEPMPGCTFAADVNGSGDVDTDDLLLLRRALAGLEEIPNSSGEFSCTLS